MHTQIYQLCGWEACWVPRDCPFFICKKHDISIIKTLTKSEHALRDARVHLTSSCVEIWEDLKPVLMARSRYTCQFAKFDSVW